MELWLLPSQAGIERLGLPGWRRLMARADSLPAIEPGLDAALASMVAQRGRVPWAALLAGAERAQAHDWLAADLVCVRAELTGARLMACAVDAGDSDRSQAALFEAARPWLQEEGFELVEIRTGRALLRCPEAAGDPQTPAPDALLGCDLRDGLPQDLRWQRRINEFQILLTQHPVNQQREARGLPVWNTLWFWGFGRRSDLQGLPAHRWHSEDPLLLALAQELGVESARAPLWRDLRDPRTLARAWADGLRPGSALLRTACGGGWQIRPWQRLRFWR